MEGEGMWNLKDYFHVFSVETQMWNLVLNKQQQYLLWNKWMH